MEQQRRIVLFALVLAVSQCAVPARAGTPWLPPVDGPVVRRFLPPAHPGAAGHRGVDFAAPPGTPVRAAAGGSVTFAGMVAGGRHVVVGHAGGVRTSYSFLASAAVRTGDRVAAGAVLGHSGRTGPGHRPGVVHFGVRKGGVYVDPGGFLGLPPLLRIRLAPVGGPPAPLECGPAGPGRGPGAGGYTGAQPGPRPGIHTPALHR